MFEVILNNVLLAYIFIKNKMDSISLLCKRISNDVNIMCGYE